MDLLKFPLFSLSGGMKISDLHGKKTAFQKAVKSTKFSIEKRRNRLIGFTELHFVVLFVFHIFLPSVYYSRTCTGINEMTKRVHLFSLIVNEFVNLT